MELSLAVKKAVRTYKAIETDGVTLYPIPVSRWDEFALARPALELMQQTLPVKYLSMPLLSAYYAMDYEAVEAESLPTGLFGRALLLLSLALRLGRDGEGAEQMAKHFRLRVDGNDPLKLVAVEFSQDGETMQSIAPVQFARLREIIAAQNGVELIGADANPELVEAERDIAEQKSAKLSGDFGELFSTVAALGCEDEESIMEWPIKKFMDRKDAYARVLGYLVCGVSEASGAKWNGGNPCPSPFFSRLRQGSGALIALDRFANGAGAKAVAEKQTQG